MKKIRIHWNSERLLSFSAIGISFITLIIFVYQTNLMSRQNYLSIMPYLALTTTHDKANHTFELNMKNHGVGPAIIASAALLYEGEKYDLVDYDNQIYKCLQSIAPVLDSIEVISFASVYRGMAIPANSEYNILAVKNAPEDYQLMTTTLSQLMDNGLDFEIVYKSIQDEQWKIRGNSEGPKKLN